MRPPERIDNFLAKVDWFKLMCRWGIDYSYFEEMLHSGYNDLIKYWKENPDLRFGQACINLNWMPDKLNIWNDEESDILIDQGVPPREVYFWTSYYDEYMNRLPEPKRKLIKDLDDDHLNNICLYCTSVQKQTPELIIDEINYRNGKQKLL